MKRGVRSYVLRQGRTTPAQQRALDELFAVYGIPYRQAPLEPRPCPHGLSWRDVDERFVRDVHTLIRESFTDAGIPLHLPSDEEFARNLLANRLPARLLLAGLRAAKFGCVSATSMPMSRCRRRADFSDPRSTSAITTPDAPARAVRPERWT